MRRLVALALTGVALGVPAAAAAAQALTGSIGFAGGSVRSRTRLGASDEVSSGAVFGGEGRVRLGRVTADVAYVEGSLAPDSGTAASRGYVEGAFLVSVTTVPGVALRVGPHARAYISSAGTQRWMFWTARLRGERSLIAPTMTGFAELWAAWSANVNVSEPFGSARGGVVGIGVRFPRSPVWGRLSYGIEHARMGDGARLETVECVSLMVGVGPR